MPDETYHWPPEDADGTVTPHTNQLKAEPVLHVQNGTIPVWFCRILTAKLYVMNISLTAKLKDIAVFFSLSDQCQHCIAVQVRFIGDQPLWSGRCGRGHPWEDRWGRRSEHRGEDVLHGVGWLFCPCHHQRTGVGQAGTRLWNFPHHLWYSGWAIQHRSGMNWEMLKNAEPYPSHSKWFHHNQ